MKTFKYKPEAAQGENAKFQGYLEIRKIKYTEKLEFLKESGLKLDGEKSSMDDLSGNEKLGFVLKMISFAKPFIVKVDLTHLSSGEKLESIDDLEYNEDASSILQEVASKLLNGFSLGN